MCTSAGCTHKWPYTEAEDLNECTVTVLKELVLGKSMDRIIAAKKQTCLSASTHARHFHLIHQKVLCTNVCEDQSTYHRLFYKFVFECWAFYDKSEPP